MFASHNSWANLEHAQKMNCIVRAFMNGPIIVITVFFKNFSQEEQIIFSTYHCLHTRNDISSAYFSANIELIFSFSLAFSIKFRMQINCTIFLYSV